MVFLIMRYKYLHAIITAYLEKILLNEIGADSTTAQTECTDHLR